MQLDQLDLFAGDDKVALPTKISACRVAAKAAKRLGVDYVGMCRHCGRGVCLVGVWRADGWLHGESGAADCRTYDLAVREQYAHQVQR